MNKVIFIFAVAIVLTGCGKDQPAPPSEKQQAEMMNKFMNQKYDSTPLAERMKAAHSAPGIGGSVKGK